MKMDRLADLWFEYKHLKWKNCGNFTGLDFAQLKEIVDEFNKFDPVYLKISGCNAGRIISRIGFFLLKNKKINSLSDTQVRETHYVPKF